MRWLDSIRARLMLGATLVLIAFVAAAGWAVQRAHEDSVRAARFAQLQSTVYLLLAEAEVDATGALVMPPAFPEPRLSLPGSGLYASVVNVARREEWRSPSTVGIVPPFLRDVAVGQWRMETVSSQGHDYLAIGYGVNWAGSAQAARAGAVGARGQGRVRSRDRDLRAHLVDLARRRRGAAAAVADAAPAVGPGAARRGWRARSAASSTARKLKCEGRYPSEITALTSNLNTLIKQERLRQTRYREALSFLAHSLKTPLAVLRTALHAPAELPAVVTQQVARMDDIVQHQLGRAAASGASRFAPYLALAPVLHRIRDSLAKVYADKGLAFDIDCPPELAWRIDEGDAFEMLGNVLDNAAKWARRQVAVSVRREGDRLQHPGRRRRPRLRRHPSDPASCTFAATRRCPGHGVGLAVVNDLVASHDGELQLSRSELGGARLDIVLRAA